MIINFIMFLVIFLASNHGVRLMENIPDVELLLTFRFISFIASFGMTTSIIQSLLGV